MPLFMIAIAPGPLSWIAPTYAELLLAFTVSVRVPGIAAVVTTAVGTVPLRAPITGLKVPVSSVPPFTMSGVTPFPNPTALPATSLPPVTIMLAAVFEPESVSVLAPAFTRLTLAVSLPLNVDGVVEATVRVPTPPIMPPGPPLRLPTVGE